jgi:phosphate uptake regulator
MDQRKIQQVGNGTYTVSLPKEWARGVDIEAGSVVTLRAHLDDLLVVQAAESDDDGALDVEVGDEAAARLEQLLRAAYAAGIERVRFTAPEGFDDAQKRALKRGARNLCGLTVDTESGTELSMETLLDSRGVSVQQSVRQLTYVALGAHESAVAAVTSDDLEDPIPQDDHADRMYALVDRHFQRALVRLEEVDALGLTRPQLFGCWRTARELERVADHAERIAAIGAELDAPAPATADRLTALAGRTHDVVETAVDTVLDDPDRATAQRALTERDAIRSDVRAFEADLLDGDDAVHLVRVLDSLERTAEHGGNVAEVGLGMALSGESL